MALQDIPESFSTFFFAALSSRAKGPRGINVNSEGGTFLGLFSRS